MNQHYFGGKKGIVVDIVSFCEIGVLSGERILSLTTWGGGGGGISININGVLSSKYIQSTVITLCK